MGVLTREDKKEVEAAIGRAEQRSAGEVVVAVLPRCARYGEERLMVAAGWGVGFCLLGHHMAASVPCYLWIAAQLPMTLLLYSVLRMPFLLRLLVRRRRMETAVQARAYQVFAQRGVHKTRQRTGLLILIAETEHQVVILGDQGIDTTVGQGGWSKHVEAIVNGIREGALAHALVRVIDDLGALIAKHHPRRPDDTNELPDALVDA